MMRNENDLDMLMSGDPELANESITVSQINVHGCHRTYASVIKRAFSRVNKASSMEELSEAIKDGLDHASSLNVHEQISVGVSVDESKADGIVLDLFVQEKPRKITYALGGDVTLSGNKNVIGAAHLRSTLGLGEQVDLETTINQDKHVSFLSRIKFPFVPTLDGYLALSGYTRVPDRLTPLMSSSSNGVALTAKLNDRHSLEYRFDSRTNHNHNVFVSKKVIVADMDNSETSDEDKDVQASKLLPDSELWSEVSPHSINASLTHNYTVNALNSNTSPTSGAKLSLSTSVSGLGNVGDVHLASSILKTHIYVPIVKNVLTGSVHATVGGAVPLGKDNAVSLNDRFRFERVRGYTTLGASHPETSEEYGGNVVGNATVRLSAPVPIAFLRDQFGMRLHTFAQTGNVINYDFKKEGNDSKQLIEQFKSGMQTSYGAGFFFNLPIGRMEFNWCKQYSPTAAASGSPKFEWKFFNE